MGIIASSDDSNNKNIERINFEYNPLKIIFRLKDGRIVSIEEKNDNEGNFYLACKVLSLEDGKPGDIIGRYLAGRTKWKKVKKLDILPKDAVKIPL